MADQLRIGTGDSFVDPLDKETDRTAQVYRMSRKVLDIADAGAYRDAELRARAEQQYEERRIQAWRDYFAEQGQEYPYE